MEENKIKIEALHLNVVQKFIGYKEYTIDLTNSSEITNYGFPIFSLLRGENLFNTEEPVQNISNRLNFNLNNVQAQRTEGQILNSTKYNRDFRYTFIENMSPIKYNDVLIAIAINYRITPVSLLVQSKYEYSSQHKKFVCTSGENILDLLPDAKKMILDKIENLF